MNMTKCFFGLSLLTGFLFLPIDAFSGERIVPEIHITKLSCAPVINGKIDDLCWEQATKIEDFHLFRGQKADQEKPSEKTVVYIGYDEDHLFIAFKCFKSNIGDIKAEIKERDGKVHHDDSVEVFLNTAPARSNYYHFIVNSIGTKYDAFVKGGIGDVDKEWSSEEWQVGTNVSEESWTAEISIPFRILNIRSQKEWRINFTRNNTIPYEHISWVPIQSHWTWHIPEQFGYLKGLDIPDYTSLIVSEINPGSCMGGKNTFKITLENTTDVEKNVEVKVSIINSKGKETSYSQKVLVPAESVKEIKMKYKIPEEDIYYYKLHIVHYPGGKIFYTYISPGIKAVFMNTEMNRIFRDNEPIRINVHLNISDDLLQKTFLMLEIFKQGEKNLPPKIFKKGPLISSETELIFSDIGPGRYLGVLKLVEESNKKVISSAKLKFIVIEDFFKHRGKTEK